MKGATSYSFSYTTTYCYFNPRSREGSDAKEVFLTTKKRISIHAPVKGATELYLKRVLIPEFQSTLPWRERPLYIRVLQHQIYFNPRSREGSDANRQVDRFSALISIHAPVKGATLRSHWLRTFYFNFNPRSREGSDRVSCWSILRLSYFNPRSREGSDLSIYDARSITSDFNPRSREGSDPSCYTLDK